MADGNFQLNLPGHHGGDGEVVGFTTVSLNYRLADLKNSVQGLIGLTGQVECREFGRMRTHLNAFDPKINVIR